MLGPLIAAFVWVAPARAQASSTTPANPASASIAATATVTGRVEFSAIRPDRRTHKAATAAPPTVLWLTPAGGASPPPGHGFRLVQKNKMFDPHVLVVPVGTPVDFPNQDPFFHNVFSLFEGKRFDLGLYEAGGTRTVHFDRPGISYIFCNIHPEMGAVVIALRTPYFAKADAAGNVTFPEVPEGRYRLEVWSELASPEALQALAREVTISRESPTLGTILIPTLAQKPSHTNKYGADYDPAEPPPYRQP